MTAFHIPVDNEGGHAGNIFSYGEIFAILINPL